MDFKGIDIFCNVIDNYGDAGVVYRVAKEIKKEIGNKEVRIFLNRYDEIVMINPKIDKNASEQEIDGITYLIRSNYIINSKEPNSVIIEAFGCDIEKIYLDKIKRNTLILNLEYLSAEKWTEDYHKMESFTGNKFIKKYFFMPGFSEKSGGLIIDSKIKEKDCSKNILNKYYSGSIENVKIGTIFSYEHNFEELILNISDLNNKCILFIMGEKSQESFKKSMKDYFQELESGYYRYKMLEIIFMPFVTQEEYDDILSVSDFNFVRGEESLARAALSGKPFIWHAYLQEEMIHMEKVEAFLDIFAQFANDKKKFEKYRNLVYNYNCRKKNDFEKLKEESFVCFFEDFEDIGSWSKEFSAYLTEKCNLVKKLLYFINHENFKEDI